MTHVSDRQLVECFQSAYRTKHSIDTLLFVTSKYANVFVDKSVIRVGMVTITASRCAQCLGVCIDRHLCLTRRSMCRKLAVLARSTCATLIKLAVFFPDREVNALPMPLSHHSLNTTTVSYSAHLHLTSPVYNDYITRLPG